MKVLIMAKMTEALKKAQYRAELKAKDHLQTLGYDVFRVSGKKRVFDLIGVNEGRVVGVRVKSCLKNRVPDYTELKVKIADFKVPNYFKKYLWIEERRKRWHRTRIKHGTI